MLSLTGVLLAAFVPTFLREVHTSKLAEATELLDTLHREAALYYAKQHAVAGSVVRACLPEGAGPYPATPSSELVEVDFSKDEAGAATWRALGQTQPRSLRYSYQVVVPEPGCAAHPKGVTISFRAQGDLDGDGTLSLLERRSVADEAQLVPDGPLRIVDRLE